MKWLFRFIRKLFLIAVTLVLICTAIYVYISKVEPRALTVTDHTLASSQLPKAFEGMRIVQFSDVHVGPDYSLRQLRHLINRINAQHPDIIVFTGDLFDNFSQYEGDPQDVFHILAQLKAPLGKFAVYGNHDRGGGASRIYQSGMEMAGFDVLLNESKVITLPNGPSITISGLDDFLLGNPRIKSTLGALDPNQFQLLLVHEPDVADQFTEYPIDVQLSGHSHGGQVQIPGVGALITTSLGTKYLEGSYTISGSYRDLQLYVNTGIGTSRAKLRLGVPPEITVFTLSSEQLR